MNCNWNAMLKIAGGSGVVLAIAYFAVPAAQAFILASAPILLALICSVAMIAMAITMNRGKAHGYPKPDASPGADADPRKA